MTLENTFLEKLDHVQDETGLRTLLNSIEKQLKKSLTTCQDDLTKDELAKGYGLFSIQEILAKSTEPTEKIGKLIRENLHKHESRLIIIQVKTSRKDQPLLFEIQAKLKSSRYAAFLAELIFKLSWDKQGHTLLKSTPIYKKNVNQKRLINSVKQNLENILNTRRGSVMTHPENYGLPDFNDLVFNTSQPIEEICQAVKENISKYEPRVTEPITVEHLPDENQPLNLQFKITAQLVKGTNQPTTKIAFQTTTTDSGHFTLE